MTAPALPDASGLAETVQRARALLDDGDVIAARLLAAGAYDQAKAAASFAARVKAGDRLVTKARRLQGDALLIETRARIVVVDEYDAAQEAGLVRKPGQRGKAVQDDNRISVPTAEEVGLTKEEVHAGRRLRDAERREPGIVARAIAARLAAGLEPSRANLRAAIGTASAPAAERGHNLYETPSEAMPTLLALESFAPTVLEPACGRGAIARPLEAAGYAVEIADLVDYGTATADGECQRVEDFLATRPPSPLVGEGGSARSAETHKRCSGHHPSSVSASPRHLLPQGEKADIVTNPPYGPVLNGFVAHALRVWRPRKMALLLNLNFLCGFDDEDRRFAMDDNPPARIHVFTRRLPMMHRDGWDGEHASSRMNTAWFVWTLRRQPDGAEGYGGPTLLNRVDWKDFEGVSPLPPGLDGRRAALVRARQARGLAG